MTVSEENIAAERPQKVPKAQQEHSRRGIWIEGFAAFTDNGDSFPLDSFRRTNLTAGGHSVAPYYSIASGVKAQNPVQNPTASQDEENYVAGRIGFEGFKLHEIPLSDDGRQHAATLHRNSHALTLREHPGYMGEHLFVAYYQLFHKKSGPKCHQARNIIQKASGPERNARFELVTCGLGSRRSTN